MRGRNKKSLCLFVVLAMLLQAFTAYAGEIKSGNEDDSANVSRIASVNDSEEGNNQQIVFKSVGQGSAANNYSEAKKSGISNYWKYWDQFQSSNSNVQNSGCRIVAFSKVLTELGVVNDYEAFNPDILFQYGVEKGFFASNVEENGDTGKVVLDYSSKVYGRTVIKEYRNWDLSNNISQTECKKYIMDSLKAGYSVILGKKAENNRAGHYVQIDREDSLKYDTIYINPVLFTE